MWVNCVIIAILHVYINCIYSTLFCIIGYRLYAVLGNAKKEACLVEINVEK